MGRLVGIAFSGKSVLAAYATYELLSKQSSDVILTDQHSQEDWYE